MPGRRPLRELDLRPVDAARRRWFPRGTVPERTGSWRVTSEQRGLQLVDHGARRAPSRPCRRSEGAVVVCGSPSTSAPMLVARPLLAEREAADHQLLALHVLDLQPGARALAGLVVESRRLAITPSRPCCRGRPSIALPSPTWSAGVVQCGRPASAPRAAAALGVGQRHRRVAVEEQHVEDRVGGRDVLHAAPMRAVGGEVHAAAGGARSSAARPRRRSRSRRRASTRACRARRPARAAPDRCGRRRAARCGAAKRARPPSTYASARTPSHLIS